MKNFKFEFHSKVLLIVSAMIVSVLSDSFGNMEFKGNMEITDTIVNAKMNTHNNAITFHLNQNGGTMDDVLFYINENSTYGYDKEYDILKPQENSGLSSLYLTSEDDTKYKVSSIPQISSSISIPMNIDCVNKGIFVVSVTGGVNFEYRCPLTLEDKELNRFIDLRVDTVYSFYHTPDMKSDRFEIHFNTITDRDNLAGEIFSEIKSLPGVITIRGLENESFTANLYTIDGRLINTSKGVLLEGIRLETTNQSAGICILHVFNQEHRITKKIYTR